MPWSIFTQGGGDDVAVGWAQELLKSIDAPLTPGNLQFIYDWEVSEGSGGKYNPLNQGPVPGQPQLTTTGSQYGGGAADFASWTAGLQGAADYLEMSNFTAILQALRQNNPAAAKQALIASPWASSHYDYGAAFSDQPLPGGKAVIPAGVPTGSTSGSGLLGGFFDTILKSLNFSFWSQGVPNVSQSTSDIAQSIGAVALPLVKFAEALDWFFHPGHWVRLLAGVGGGILVLGGVYQMSHAGGGA